MPPRRWHERAWGRGVRELSEALGSSGISASHTFGVDLAVVRIADVHPHEHPDPSRVDRLRRRLVDEATLRDPIMVARTPEMEGLLLLDGTNRRAALDAMRVPHVLAQIVDYEDQRCVSLLTWSHLVDMDADALLRDIGAVPGLTVRQVPQDQADVELERAGRPVAIHHDGKSWVVQSERREPLGIELTRLVALWEPRMQREARDQESIGEKLSEVRSRPGGHDWPLITFPRINRQQVVRLAARGTPIPAGITRHVIRCGRALRVNVPISLLDSPGPPAETQRAFEAHLARLNPRRYLEQTVLFDS